MIDSSELLERKRRNFKGTGGTHGDGGAGGVYSTPAGLRDDGTECGASRVIGKNLPHTLQQIE